MAAGEGVSNIQSTACLSWSASFAIQPLAASKGDYPPILYPLYAILEQMYFVHNWDKLQKCNYKVYKALGNAPVQTLDIYRPAL